MKGSFLLTPALFPTSPLSLSVPSHTRCKLLTRRPRGLPLPHPLCSHDPLTSSCFSCCRRQLSKCLRGGLLSFSSSSDQFPNWTLWHALKHGQRGPDSIARFRLHKGEMKHGVSDLRKCRIMSGEMLKGGKYAQKDASKVNMYEIAQSSRASAAPAKSCTEVERTRKKRAEGEEAEPEFEASEASATALQMASRAFHSSLRFVSFPPWRKSFFPPFSLFNCGRSLSRMCFFSSLT